jgi:hypothetical protein
MALRQPENPKSLRRLDLPFFSVPFSPFLVGGWGIGGEERKVVKVDWGTGFTCYCNKLSLPQLVAELQPDL